MANDNSKCEFHIIAYGVANPFGNRSFSGCILSGACGHIHPSRCTEMALVGRASACSPRGLLPFSASDKLDSLRV